MIIIPAFEPKQSLLILTKNLLDIFKRNNLEIMVLVVNDGSINIESKDILNSVKCCGVKVINHPYNRGKGAALKTGFEYAKRKNKQWIVTADADGQHLVEDIFNIIKSGLRNRDNLIIGVRNFRKIGIQFRSRFGNLVTCILFRFFHGKKIEDTQSGLRFIPKTLFIQFINIPFNYYDFEFAALILAGKRKAIQQIPIATIYRAGNPSSHFRKLRDSALIYYVFILSVFAPERLQQ